MRYLHAIDELDKKYIPEREHFVSEEEQKLIIKSLNLANIEDAEELGNLRDFVVLFYEAELNDPDVEHRKLCRDKCSAITCLIDSFLYGMGQEP